jgi:hypothetical protein
MSVKPTPMTHLRFWRTLDRIAFAALQGVIIPLDPILFCLLQLRDALHQKRAKVGGVFARTIHFGDDVGQKLARRRGSHIDIGKRCRWPDTAAATAIDEASRITNSLRYAEGVSSLHAIPHLALAHMNDVSDRI